MKTRPRRAGRKPLPSTLWLARRIAEGADPRYLFAEWRAAYRAAVGYDLYDERRSYRAALANARKQKEGIG